MVRENERGVTLLELLVVISIIGILAISLGYSFAGWQGNYRIESETKQIFSDIMDARVRALTVHRDHFILFETTGYATYDDTFPPPDGNATLEKDQDTCIKQKTLDEYELKNAGVSNLPITFSIDTRGLIYPQRDIRIVHTQNPDYDCLAITQARIRMAKFNGSKCIDK
ncbi:MAG: prepilin-type N-terminal cleavage/methylation domain-containing protein [Thermodesulfovibrionales bacterium]|nr:prepilin-type N-terminal cleavage/methylation domain-containing protein [Thermodesulfovibrionales bacterium]